MYERHSDEELIIAFREKAGKEEHLEIFIQKYHEIFDDAEQEPGYFYDAEEDELPKDMILWHSVHIFLEKFLPLIENGHHLKWAEAFADNSEFENFALGETYAAFQLKDKGHAQNELITYCKSKGEDDPVMHQYLIELFEEKEYPDAFEHAKNYSKAYNAQMANGRSELFARTYGDLSSDSENLEIFCFVAADTFEKKLLEGWEEYEAHKYAMDYARMIANNFHDLADIEKDPDFDIVKDLRHQRNDYN